MCNNINNININDNIINNNNILMWIVIMCNE